MARKRRSVVDWMTTFIDNMRTQRYEEEGPIGPIPEEADEIEGNAIVLKASMVEDAAIVLGGQSNVSGTAIVLG